MAYGTKVRLGFLCALLLSIIWAPWWAAALVGFLGIIFTPFFYESIIAALALDLLFSPTELRLTLLTTGAFILTEIIRTRLRI